MFFAAPFLALACIVLFPLIGLAMLARTGASLAPAAPCGGKPKRQVRRSERRRRDAGVGIARFVKNVALFFAAPFVALAYIALFPVIGLAMLAWTGGRAWRQRKAVG